MSNCTNFATQTRLWFVIYWKLKLNILLWKEVLPRRCTKIIHCRRNENKLALPPTPFSREDISRNESNNESKNVTELKSYANHSVSYKKRQVWERNRFVQSLCHTTGKKSCRHWACKKIIHWKLFTPPPPPSVFVYFPQEVTPLN